LHNEIEYQKKKARADRSTEVRKNQYHQNAVLMRLNNNYLSTTAAAEANATLT